MLGNLRWLIFVKRAEVQHVPVVRHFRAEAGKLALKLRIEHRVVFEDQHAGRVGSLRFADDFDVTEQAAVSAGAVSPAGGLRDSLAVDGREALHVMNAVTRELSVYTLPALGPSIEIDTDDFFEQDGQDFFRMNMPILKNHVSHVNAYRETIN